MFLTKDLPVDEKYPKSCVYWIYDETKHTDPMTSGYVGVSMNGAEHRFKQHWRDVENGSSLKIHRAMRKYSQNIKIKTLIVADTEFCLLAEAMLRPLPNVEGLWNLNAGGETTRKGAVVSESTKSLLRAANLGKKYSQETKDLLSRQRKGRLVSEITKSRISSANKGRIISEEHRDRLSSYRQAHVESTPSWNRGVAKGNHAIWLLADEMLSAKNSNPLFGPIRVAALFNLKEWNIRYLWKKLKSGWIPLEDKEWIAFRDTNQKEAANA